jgi:uncharacterized Rmd1/YagE family protein
MEQREIKAFYLAKSINLDRIPGEMRSAEVRRLRTRAIYAVREGQYVVCYTFGVVAFLGMPADEVGRIRGIIEPAFIDRVDGWSDTYALTVDFAATEDTIEFDHVRLHDFTVDHVDLVCRMIAQSVAMTQYDQEVDHMIAEFRFVFEGLRSSGRLRVRTRRILRVVGANNDIMRTVIADLALLHSPRSTWEDAHLEKLWRSLRTAFDVDDRFERLRMKLEYLRQSTEQLLSILQDRRATQLELIIIALFVFEIGIVVLEYFQS